MEQWERRQYTMAGKHFDNYVTLTVACLSFIQSDHGSITE